MRLNKLTAAVPDTVKDRLPETTRRRIRNHLLKASTTVDNPVLLVVFDSCRYDAFTQADTPFLDQYDVQKGYTSAHWTIPSHEAMVRGFLPVPAGVSSHDILHNDYNTGPMPLTMEHGYTFGYTALQLLSPTYSVSCQFINYFDDYDCLAALDSAPQITTKAAAAMQRHDAFFGVLNYGETHFPWSLDPGEADTIMDNTTKAGTEQDARNTLKDLMADQAEQLDEHVKQLHQRAPDGTQIIVTSDHGTLFGENGQTGHHDNAGSHDKLYEVPLVHWTV